MNPAGIPTPPPGDREPPDGQDLARRVTVLETRFDAVLPTLATKTDLAELRTELLGKLDALRDEVHVDQGALRGELRAGQEALRGEIRAGQEALRGELRASQEALRAEMERLASSLYKWMAATLITIMLSFVGLFVGLTRTHAAVPSVAQDAKALSSNPAPRTVALRPQLAGGESYATPRWALAYISLQLIQLTPISVRCLPLIYFCTSIQRLTEQKNGNTKP